ncbi:hypothetical protein AVEN_261644-1 [Araneus ventricosus]|uniref:Uncharacterized protein n=1 Tax=Araneus ventricosus TaxID=182803 RepID=A0A4Y2HWB0_ARAVE|nr:hypothetical protein AVEN_261644-1 [Araneus ventricosus]
MIRNDGIQMNSKSKTSCADSNLRPRCEASGTSKDLPRLRPRDENPPKLQWCSARVQYAYMRPDQCGYFCTTLGGKRLAHHIRFSVHQPRIQGGSSAESGFEPGPSIKLDIHDEIPPRNSVASSQTRSQRIHLKRWIIKLKCDRGKRE